MEIFFKLPIVAHRIILRLPGEQQARTRVLTVPLATPLRRSRRLQSRHPEFGLLTHDRNQSRSRSAAPPDLNIPAANMEALAALFMDRNVTCPYISRLPSSNLWDIVTSAPPHPATPEWTRKNQRAVAEIHNCCEPAQQDLFSDYETAKEAWDKLKATFETRDSATIQRLYNDFNNIRKASDETMLTYITRVKTAAKQLTNAGEIVSTTNLLNKAILVLAIDTMQ